MPDCPKCGASFDSRYKLERHGRRRRPCDPAEAAGAAHRCPHCGRGYSRPDSVRRHEATCVMAQGGVEARIARYEATLRRELAARDEALRALEARLAPARASIRDAVEPEEDANEAGSAPAPPFDIHAEMARAAPPGASFDGPGRLAADARIIGGACRALSPAAEEANEPPPRPAVLEYLLTVVRDAYNASLDTRNIMPSAGQRRVVRVWNGARWVPRSLAEATRALLDSAAGQVAALVLADRCRDREQIPDWALGPVSWVPSMYEDAPGWYVERAAPAIARYIAERPAIDLSALVV